jgi:hypothetical protein
MSFCHGDPGEIGRSRIPWELTGSWANAAGWLEEFIAELLAFPGRHDDQVDALVQGLAWKRSRRGEVSVSVVGGMI